MNKEDLLADEFQDTLNKANNAITDIIEAFNMELCYDPELEMSARRIYEVIQRLYAEKLSVENVQYKIALFAFPTLVHHDGK